MIESAGNSNVLNDLSINKKHPAETKGGNELGQKAFLKLMITQMENQDPLSPQENSDFIAQLAQFSSVESLDQLNNKFTNFSDSFVANQALQASSLVGRSVTVPTSSTRLEMGGVVTALVDLPSHTNNLNVNIHDASGALVDQIRLGAQSAGDVNLRWDGRAIELNGQPVDWSSSHPNGLPPGNYTFKVTAPIEGKDTELQTYLSANVNSVTVGSTGALTLNLAGVGAVSLADVKQFNE